jgi:hypothetical protein
VLKLIGVDCFRLDYDTNYGAVHRSGWSVHVDGVVYIEFARWPLVAIVVALWKWRAAKRDVARENAGS